MRKTRRNVCNRQKTRSRKQRAASPSYIKYTFNRWENKYKAGINMNLSTRKLIKCTNRHLRMI